MFSSAKPNEQKKKQNEVTSQWQRRQQKEKKTEKMKKKFEILFSSFVCYLIYWSKKKLLPVFSPTFYFDSLRKFNFFFFSLVDIFTEKNGLFYVWCYLLFFKKSNHLWTTTFGPSLIVLGRAKAERQQILMTELYLSLLLLLIALLNLYPFSTPNFCFHFAI